MEVNRDSVLTYLTNGIIAFGVFGSTINVNIIGASIQYNLSIPFVYFSTGITSNHFPSITNSHCIFSV